MLSALFVAVGRCNGIARTDADAKSAVLSFYKQHVYIAMGASVQRSERLDSRPGLGEGVLWLAIRESWRSTKDLRTWRDQNGAELESQLAEIAIEIVLLAEVRYPPRPELLCGIKKWEARNASHFSYGYFSSVVV